MKRLFLYLVLVLSASFLTWSCDTAVDSAGELEENTIVSSKPNNNAGPTSLATCQNAGDTGLTAVYVNESVNGATIDFANHSCDMAIYFDENAPKNATVRGVTIIQNRSGGGRTYGVWNEGAEVTVTRSTFTTDFSGEHVPIRFDAGAGGMISRNELSGTHRAGILLRGQGTDVQVKGNTITGTGAKSSGWAENGMQVDQGATGDITGNKISEHWWDGESDFASGGLLLFSSNAKVTNNTFHNNEFSIYLFGEGNKVTGNNTSSDIVSQSAFDFKAYGALLYGGKNNHLAGNSFSAKEGTGDVGVYISPSTTENKVTGNRISGFTYPIYDGGTDNMIKGTPAPPNGM